MDGSCTWIKIISEIITPLLVAGLIFVVGIIGNNINQSISEAQLKVEMIKLAIGVLVEKPDEDINIEGLREWAAKQVLGTYSCEIDPKICMSQALQDQLIEKKLPRAEFDPDVIYVQDPHSPSG